MTLEFNIGIQQIESCHSNKSLEDKMDVLDCRKEIRSTTTVVQGLPYMPNFSSSQSSISEDDSTSSSSTSLKRCRESLSSIIENQFKTPSPKHIEIKFTAKNTNNSNKPKHRNKFKKTSNNEPKQKTTVFQSQSLLRQPSSFVFQTPKSHNSDDEHNTNTPLPFKSIFRNQFLKLSLEADDKTTKVRKLDKPQDCNMSFKESIQRSKHHHDDSDNSPRGVSKTNIQSIILPHNITDLEKLTLPSLQFSKNCNDNASNKFSESGFCTPSSQIQGACSFTEVYSNNSITATNYARSAMAESLRKNIHTLLMPTLSETDSNA